MCSSNWRLPGTASPSSLQLRWTLLLSRKPVATRTKASAGCSKASGTRHQASSACCAVLQGSGLTNLIGDPRSGQDIRAPRPRARMVMGGCRPVANLDLCPPGQGDRPAALPNTCNPRGGPQQNRKRQLFSGCRHGVSLGTVWRL